jgi:ATP phosphoribosyltransferase regulatory subunit
MTHPIPPGSRDILPDEMRELRALQGRLAEVFESFGYGEVATPTVEFDDVLTMGGATGVAAAHRFFDAQGRLLAMRADSTLPIARVVANRYASAEPPFRFFYNARAYRSVRPQRGQTGEFFQAGVELVGSPAPDGTAEVVEVLSAALDAAGLNRAVIGLGDAALYGQLLTELGVDADEQSKILGLLASRDLVGLEAELASIGLSDASAELLRSIPSLRGGPEVLDEAKSLGGEAVARAVERVMDTYDAIAARGIGERVQLDLGLLRDLGYYTGAILEVYDPALGHVLGGGGRYDDLMGRFGRPLPAVGFALFLERLHIAQAEEERIAEEGSS